MRLVDRNHYQVLGVSRDASDAEIERAFRSAARRVHPDLHGGDGAAEERMKELNRIRATLTDPTARATYDARLRQEQAAQAARVAPAPATASKAPEEWTPERGSAWLGGAPPVRPAPARPGTPPSGFSAFAPRPAPPAEIERGQRQVRRMWAGGILLAALATLTAVAALVGLFD
jgi:curved DNA-binding protein CbpA